MLAIAASFGGGGHTHAAGFSIPLQADGSLPSTPAPASGAMMVLASSDRDAAAQ